jgi:hypothetical protein
MMSPSEEIKERSNSSSTLGWIGVQLHSKNRQEPSYTPGIDKTLATLQE